MATDAKNIHRRHGTSVPKSDLSRKKPASEETVAVRFNPENPPHEEFKDFYPLHVTKVEQPKTVSLGLVIVGIIFILGVAAGSGWYVLKQEKADKTTQSSTMFSDSNPTEKKLAADTEKIGSTKPITGGFLYTNSAFMFQLTLPAAWEKVEVSDVPDEIAAETVRPSELIDFIYGSGGGQPGTLVLQLRVDTESSYTQFVAASSAPPTKLLDNGTYVVSLHHQEKTTATTPADVAAVIAGTDAVIQSIQALVPATK